MIAGVSSILGNLARGLVLVVLPFKRELAFQPGILSTLFGLLLSVLLMGIFDYARQAGDIYFNDAGAAQYGTLLFLVFLTALLICSLHAQYARILALLTAGFSVLPWYVLILFAMRHYSPESINITLVLLAMLLWGLLLAFQVIRLSFTVPLQRAYLLTLGVALSVVTLAQVRYFQPAFFHSWDPAEYDQYADIDQESTYYQQRHLVQSKLDSLEPQRPGEVDIYFVGFAGNGDEGVFDSEVKFASKVVATQFGTAGHSVVLSSDLSHLDNEPLANTYNLHAVLNSVGALMDVEEDILFLFLTSHGSEDATIDVSLYPFDLRSLSAREVNASLDAAGIQWRVIVVSACFAGSFIEELANDKTIILTAAAADKTSFGCSNERELTYFGEAFFRNALLNERDLVIAFEQAKGAIHVREVEEELEPSNPQIHLGSAIHHKLEGLGLLVDNNGTED